MFTPRYTLRNWLMLAAFVGFGLACNGKGPEPKPVKYNVYYGNSAGGDLYVLDAESLTIIDSIPGLAGAHSATISPDGRWMYAHQIEPPIQPKVKKIDLSTKQVFGIIPDNVWGTLTLLDQGQLLLKGIPICQRDVIDAECFVLRRILDDSICGMRGPVSGTKIVAYINGTSRFRSFDIATGEFYGEYIPRLETGQVVSVFEAVLHPDGRRVLALGTAFPFWSWFVLGDLETGETLLQHQIFYAQGQIALSDDGSFAAVTDPSNQGWWETNPTIDLFELDSLTHLKRFTGGTEPDFEGWPGWVSFVPRTSLLVAAPSAKGSGPIILIDVAELRVEKMVYPPFSTATPSALAVGVRP